MTDTGFLVTLALALIAATIGAAIAVRLGQSAILGYVAAGILIGPYTGRLVEQETVAALADVGVVFLLFAVGLELSVRDLLRVRRIALLGGSIQVAGMILIGYLVGLAFRMWLESPVTPFSEGAIIGFIIPGLIAIWYQRQGVIETTLSLLTAAIIVRMVLVVFLGDVAI